MSFFPHGFRVFVCVAVFFSCNLVGFPLEMHHISKTHIMEKRHEINTSKAPVFFVRFTDILHAFDSGSKLIQAYFCQVSSSKIYICVNFHMRFFGCSLAGKILKDVNRYINGGRDNFTFYFCFVKT